MAGVFREVALNTLAQVARLAHVDDVALFVEILVHPRPCGQHGEAAVEVVGAWGGHGLMLKIKLYIWNVIKYV